MKLMFHLMLLFLAVPMSAAHASGDGILLATGGGLPGSPQFFVHLNPAGLLTVERHEMLKDPKSTELQLSKEQAQALVLLAEESDDFSIGCNSVGDGTSAEMKVVKSGASSIYSCSGARRWPVGPHIRAFIDALNHLLPKEFYVF